MRSDSIVNKRHEPLMKAYRENPELALITDVSEVVGRNLDDPFRTTVTINEELREDFVVGVHRAVGGDHDYPNPGDILCASLASCFESTMRMIANKLRIKLDHTRVRASAVVDVRGTLMVDRSVPVGFQSMKLDVEVAATAPSEGAIKALIKGAKHCCIIYQTINKGIPIEVNVNVLNAVEIN